MPVVPLRSIYCSSIRGPLIITKTNERQAIKLYMGKKCLGFKLMELFETTKKKEGRKNSVGVGED